MSKKRKNGDGTVRLRKDGRWEGRYVTHYDEKGLPKTKSVLAKTKSECVEKLKKLKVECGEIKTDRLRPDMKFANWLIFWYENYSKPKLRPTTQMSYENNIFNHIIPALGDIKLNELTQNLLQQFYANIKSNGRKRLAEHYGAGLSDRSVRSIHITCKTALERAVSENLIKANPCTNCKLPPKKSKEMQVLTTEELQRFLIQAKYEGFYELFLLELTTGLRRGEILSVLWDDINLETGELKIDKQVLRINGKLTVSTPKTKASIRTIIIPQSVCEVLKKHKEKTNSRWLFPSPRLDDIPLDPSWCRKKLQKILEHANCKKVKFHELRHTFCMGALAGGMDIKTLSSIIGHISVATTLDVYAHTTKNMQEQAAIKIDSGFVKCVACSNDIAPPHKQKPIASKFEPYKGKRRKAGTGCITKINDNLWEGRYSPKWIDDKRLSRNIYAHSSTECEEKLAELIIAMNTELANLKAKTDTL